MSDPHPLRMALVALALLALPFATAATPHSSLVIVLDGLRPDYITPALMPHLHALGESGIVAEAHHAVFPTVTRVNSPSIATGAYPAAHGLMQNTILIPEASADPIDTADAEALRAADAALGGRLLTAPTIGELLARAGRKVLVTSSGSTGSAFLLNPRPGDGSSLLNSRGLVWPPALRSGAEARLGPPPAVAYPSSAGNRWAVDAYLEIGLKELRPDVTFMWLTDPDGTAHKHGIGAPETLEGLRQVDAEIGRLLATLERRGLREQVNIFVTADHGFSTHGGPFNLRALLTARGLAAGVRIVGNQIYVGTGGDEKIRRIVELLQATEWVGAIFTRAAAPGSHEGFAAGTLSFEAIHYRHPRAADILVDPNWSDAPNAHGYPGRTMSGGVAGHGSSSPYDIGIRLIAAGPDLKRATRSQVPTGNIDLAVTLCRLQGIPAAPTMQGRVLAELLRDGSAVDAVKVERIVLRTTVASGSGHYELELHKARVGATEYIDFTRTRRSDSPQPPAR